jgi:hypothetical protein
MQSIVGYQRRVNLYITEFLETAKGGNEHAMARRKKGKKKRK